MPPRYDAAAADRRLGAQLDGLVLQGGTGISPQMYGETPLRLEWAGGPERDRYELELLDRFLNLKKPVLGICRGQQLINVAMGGTLYQDTATQKPGAQRHPEFLHGRDDGVLNAAPLLEDFLQASRENIQSR